MKAYTKCNHCSLYSSSEMNLNIRVEVRVDANVDGLTYNELKTGSLYHTKFIILATWPRMTNKNDNDQFCDLR